MLNLFQHPATSRLAGGCLDPETSSGWRPVPRGSLPQRPPPSCVEFPSATCFNRRATGGL